jgi:hypothetical protein
VADLTSIARVRAYTSLANAPNLAPEVGALISLESQAIINYIDRPIPFETNTNVMLDGSGTPRMMLPRLPILAVQALSVCGQVIPAAPSWNQPGYIANARDGTITLTGGRRFPMEMAAVVCTWTAGYQGQQTATIPAATGNETTSTITPTENVQGGFAAQVASVTDGNGVVYSVAANQSNPLAGTYGFSDGVLTFNTANANTSVTMVYYFIPGPLMQACNEMVAIDLQQRQNVGVGSKTLAGEIVKYDWKQFTDTMKSQLAPYRRVAPS